MEIIIDDKIYKDISDYCTLNEMPEVEYINHLIKQGFFDDKYGNAPFLPQKEHVDIQKVEEYLNGDITPKNISPETIEPENITPTVINIDEVKPKRGRKKKEPQVVIEKQPEDKKPKKRILK